MALANINAPHRAASLPRVEGGKPPLRTEEHPAPAPRRVCVRAARDKSKTSRRAREDSSLRKEPQVPSLNPLSSVHFFLGRERNGQSASRARCARDKRSANPVRTNPFLCSISFFKRNRHPALGARCARDKRSANPVRTNKKPRSFTIFPAPFFLFP